jgi:hypothetical protein
MRALAILLTLNASVALGDAITESDRAYLIAHLEMTTEFVVDTTRGLTKQQWLYKPGPKSWSIAECIDHLANTEDYVVRLLRERVLTSGEAVYGAFPSRGTSVKPDASKPQRMSLIQDSFVVRDMTDRTQVAAVPVEQRSPIEEIAPRSSFEDPESALQHFLKVRSATLKYVRTTNDDLRGHFLTAPLPRFNVQFADAYQWILRMSAHVERHLMQVHEIRRSKGYPRVSP